MHSDFLLIILVGNSSLTFKKNIRNLENILNQIRERAWKECSIHSQYLLPHFFFFFNGPKKYFKTLTKLKQRARGMSRRLISYSQHAKRILDSNFIHGKLLIETIAHRENQ